jgi:hypothetical protein
MLAAACAEFWCCRQVDVAGALVRRTERADSKTRVLAAIGDQDPRDERAFR